MTRLCITPGIQEQRTECEKRKELEECYNSEDVVKYSEQCC